MAFSAFARGNYPIESVELCVAFGTEDYLKTKLDPELLKFLSKLQGRIHICQLVPGNDE